MKVIRSFVFIFAVLSLRDSYADQRTIDDIIHTELIFHDCDKAHNILDVSGNLSSPASKGNLSKYLSRILGLESSNFDIVKPTAGSISPPHSNLNISNYLDPERDKKAKLCAVSLLQKIDPYGAISIPQLISVGIDRKNNITIRDQVLFELQRQQTLIQRQHFPDYILRDIYQQLENEDTLLDTSYATSLLLALSQRTEVSYQSLLEPHNSSLRDRVLFAFIIDQYKNPRAIEEIQKLYTKIDEGAKAQLISKLKYISDNQPRIIELASLFLNEEVPLVKLETIKLIKYLNQNSAYYAAYYDTHPLSDAATLKYIDHLKNIEIRVPESKSHDLKLADYSMPKEIIKLLLPIRLSPASEFCKKTTLPENLSPYDLHTETSTHMLINSMCPYRKELKNTLIEAIKKRDFMLSAILFTLLSVHEEVDEELLQQSLNFIQEIKKKYSPKEFSLFSYLILRSGNKISTSKIKNGLIQLALENIENETSGSNLIDTFLPSKIHPGIEYLASNLKMSDPYLQKKLGDKSPLVVKKILSIYANPDTEKVAIDSKSNTQLIKLLSHENLDIRRNAYIGIKLHKKENTTLPSLHSQYAAPMQFYVSRLLLDQETLTQSKNTEQNVKSYLTSLEALDCRERTIPYPKYIDTQIRTLSSQDRELVIKTQTQCIKESSFTRLRALKNITTFSEISPAQLQILVSEFIKTIELHNDTQSLITLLDYVHRRSSEQTFQLVIAGLHSKQEENIISTIDWILKNKSEYLYSSEKIRDIVAELADSDTPKVYLPASLLTYALKPTEENLKNFNRLIIKNLDQTELIVNLHLSSIIDKEVLKSPQNEQNPYYKIFVDTSVCAEEGDTTFCDQITVSPSLVYDKANFFKIILKNISYSPHAQQPSLRSVMKKLTLQLIDSGHIEELLSLNKTSEMISILKEMRVDTTNMAHAKILDFIIEN